MPQIINLQALSVCTLHSAVDVASKFYNVLDGVRQIYGSKFLRGKRFLIMDHDGSFHAAFRGLLESAGVRSVRTPSRSPNCNAYLERFHGSFKSEVANRMIILGEDHLRRVIVEYLEYYHHERNHQGLAGRIIEPAAEIATATGKVRRRQRLGGMLNYYHRDAA